MGLIVFRSLTYLIISLTLVLMAQQSYAQSGDGAGYAVEYGLGLGSMLPDQIEDVEEIQPSWSARFALGLEDFDGVELAYNNSNAKGVKYHQINLSYRTEDSVSLLRTVMYGGLDINNFRPLGHAEYKMIPGAHLGASVISLVGDILWFRADMRFSFHPGIQLWILFGFALRE